MGKHSWSPTIPISSEAQRHIRDFHLVRFSRSARFGQIKVGIHYEHSRRSLSVKIFGCKWVLDCLSLSRSLSLDLSRDLINVHNQNLPDPYVRVYLLPEFKKDKKKTKPIRDTLNPVYDDSYVSHRFFNHLYSLSLSFDAFSDSNGQAQSATFVDSIYLSVWRIIRLYSPKNKPTWAMWVSDRTWSLITVCSLASNRSI